ncbi:MAG: T9SS type A sorting domain-containing protein [bacterium]
MTKRLSAGVLLLALGAMVATTAYAERPRSREWRGGELNPATNSSVPLFFRSSAGTTWVSVGQNCAPEDTANSTHSQAEVWCFEGANGDSTWPNVPVGQNTGSKHETWDHWSKFAPPIPPSSKWHASTLDPNPFQGTDPYSAWCGCDSLGTNPGCTDVAFWIFKKGYGDDWNYSLTLTMTGQNASTGGTIRFDLNYDTECNYDYLYLEYFNNTTAKWELVTGPNGPAIFNAVSGNPDSNNGGTGRACGDDYFGSSDQADLGGGNIPYYGNSVWLNDVTFPMPAQAGGMQLRWRGFSDGAWSDADGRGDTDGIARIDDVRVTFASTGNVVTDDFSDGSIETGASLKLNGGAPGTITWTAGGLEGNTWDSWHMEFDPNYKNKGATCNFSDDWMYTARPPSGFPGTGDANGMSMFLVTPVIDCDGWTGGVMEYSNYLCAPDERDDYVNTHIRTYDASNGWSLWTDFDGFITFAGCEFWNMNDGEDLSPYMAATIDSLQLGYEMLDISQPTGDFSWGKHGNVQWLIDNVSIGSFDGSATVFTARSIDIFADTYSYVDPAHTPFLQNSAQGMWPGTQLGSSDSLNVDVSDFDGFNPTNCRIYWHVSTVDPPVFGAWQNKAMNRSQPDNLGTAGAGTYRTTIGNNSGEDFCAPAGGRIWCPGTTVEYYVKVIDNNTNSATFPRAAADPEPAYFRFEVLPFANRTVGDLDERILIVDDYGRNFVDFENSTGFDPVGGAGFGAFSDPVFDQPEDMVERALGLVYGIATPEDNPAWDIYDVQGAGSSVQCEPRISSLQPNLGGIGDDTANPVYDAVIWINGSFDAYSFADTTRIDLKAWLDKGGHLWSNGDEVAKFLGTGGNDADSTIQFLSQYMGISFANIADDQTDNRVLNMCGAAGTSLDGVTLGIYGECPSRRAFDRLTQAPAGANQQITTLATYCAGGANDNGRAAIIKNVRLASGIPTGVCIHSGFGLGALVSDASRATLLAKTFVGDFGMWNMGYVGVNNGVDAPVVANGAGFDLAAASPNPFAQNTEIAFSVPSRSHVSIEVYNILGQKVRTLVNESLEANSYVRNWDGRSDAGERVSSGIYFYKMVAGDFNATRKAVLLK